MSPRCHGNKRFKPEHVVATAMVQSTFVPSLISIEAVFIVLYQFELVTGDFSMKTAILHKMPRKKQQKNATSVGASEYDNYIAIFFIAVAIRKPQTK
jgi:hypothetical protein